MSSTRTLGNMPLRDSGWMAEQAQGLFESLNLDGGTPKWKREHLQRLRSWCSAHGKDPATVDGQLEFVAADLCDTYEGVGMALKRATTVTEARVAVTPYVNRLAASDTPTLVNTFEWVNSGGAGVRRRA